MKPFPHVRFDIVDARVYDRFPGNVYASLYGIILDDKSQEVERYLICHADLTYCQARVLGLCEMYREVEEKLITYLRSAG